jgi:hypothetical protein
MLNRMARKLVCNSIIIAHSVQGSSKYLCDIDPAASRNHSMSRPANFCMHRLLRLSVMLDLQLTIRYEQIGTALSAGRGQCIPGNRQHY